MEVQTQWSRRVLFHGEFVSGQETEDRRENFPGRPESGLVLQLQELGSLPSLGLARRSLQGKDERYHLQVRNSRRLSMAPQVPFHFLLRGLAGTPSALPASHPKSLFPDCLDRGSAENFQRPGRGRER